MNYSDVYLARIQAEEDIKKADEAVRQAIKLISGRLRSSGAYGGDLCALKKELKNFNMNTYKWKD